MTVNVHKPRGAFAPLPPPPGRGEKSEPQRPATAHPSAHAGSRRSPDSDHLPATRGFSHRASGGALSIALAGRTGGQADEVAPSHRSPASQKRRARLRLAARPPALALLVEASADETGDFPPETQPESGSPRAPSLWRVVALLARCLIAAIWPPTGFRKAKIRLAKDPRLREPPRKRKLQMTAFALS